MFAELSGEDAGTKCHCACCAKRKLENWEDAATDAEIAQEIDPSNVKVHVSVPAAAPHLET